MRTIESWAPHLYIVMDFPVQFNRVQFNSLWFNLHLFQFKVPLGYCGKKVGCISDLRIHRLQHPLPFVWHLATDPISLNCNFLIWKGDNICHLIIDTKSQAQWSYRPPPPSIHVSSVWLNSTNIKYLSATMLRQRKELSYHHCKCGLLRKLRNSKVYPWEKACNLIKEWGCNGQWYRCI